MRQLIFTMLGAIYVSSMASFCSPVEIHSSSVIEREAHQLVGQDSRIDRYIECLLGPSRFSARPEYIDGKPVKYQTSPEIIPKKKAITPTVDYLLVWTAKWCPHCKKMKVFGDRLKGEGFVVLYIDFDENEQRAKEDRIGALPTTVIYINDEEVRRVIGAGEESEERIREVLEKNSEKEADSHRIY